MSSEEKAASRPPTTPAHQHLEGTDDWTVPDEIKANPLFIEIEGNVIAALKKLDIVMRQQKLGGILSGKLPNSLFGRRLTGGQIMLWDFAGSPQICIVPGRYINFHPSVRFSGCVDITEILEFQGLTIAQVGQGEALVVQDPANKVFVIRSGGFVSYGAYGRFKILGVVDTLQQENPIKEPGSDRVLGYMKEVMSTVVVGGKKESITVASFFNVPANNCLILQQKNVLIRLDAGQHVLTNPNTTFRSFMSLSERQHTFKTQPAYTVEGVPVVLDLNLRYRVFDPITLTQHYGDALQALINPAQTAVNGVVSRLSYQQFMRAQKVGGDVPDSNHVPWLQAFKDECIHGLAALAKTHGIDVLGFEVMDRRLEGALGKDLEKQAETVLQNQMDATQIDLKNQIQKRKQEGLLQVQQIENEQKRAVSDTTYYQTTREADAAYYLSMQQAKAQAETSKLITQQENLNTISKAQAASEMSQLQTFQEVKNIISLAEARKKEIELQGEAYGSVASSHAQRIQMILLEIQKRQAMPPKTIWFESGTSSGISSSVEQGFAVAQGVALAGGEK